MYTLRKLDDQFLYKSIKYDKQIMAILGPKIRLDKSLGLGSEQEQEQECSSDYITITDTYIIGNAEIGRNFYTYTKCPRSCQFFL